MQNNADLIKLIHKNFTKFSKSQKLIADYILENYDKAAFKIGRAHV